MLSELRSQKEQIEEAILVLQRLAAGGAKRRGRPPKWMSSIAEPSIAAATPIRRKRKPFSAETKKKMAQAQQKRWAKVKGQTAV